MQPVNFFRRVASILPALAASLLLGACASNPPPAAMPAPETYRVGAPDVLAINVLPDPAILRTVTVRPDGYVTFDLIGDIEAGGRTTAQIAEDIQRRISRFKRDASVTVSVEAARSNVVSIYGEVRSVGILPLTTQTRVSEAIASRGGPTFLAWKSRVRVIRNNGDETDVFQVNLAGIYQGDLATNMLLEGGDIIVVPPTPLGTFGYLIQQIVFPYQQILGPGLSAATLVSGF
jgi:polysaccharide export outer membrane protein